ncbi:hypothetical protein [Edaphovirga cremea]|uniref:hypothetical protein n=1 Tax=Edaphovirga cremea TaxID=2267246 RepID=UPI000DEEDD88|nr:hypothetical protein [Edaphovirga cremea]
MTEKLTVGDLKHLLSDMSDDTEISFSGDLTFYRFRRWSDNEFLLEFNEAQAAPSENFRRRHPYIQVSLGKSGTFKNI